VAVPKRRQSSSRRDMRRANHDRITAPNVSACPKCLAPKAPHRVCRSCDTYKDRVVFASPDAGSQE